MARDCFRWFLMGLFGGLGWTCVQLLVHAIQWIAARL